MRRLRDFDVQTRRGQRNNLTPKLVRVNEYKREERIALIQTLMDLEEPSYQQIRQLSTTVFEMNRKKNTRNDFISTVRFHLVANVYHHLENFLLILMKHRKSFALVERPTKPFTINCTLLAELIILSIIVSSDRFTAKATR
ncbi:hypothetical protein BD560DRAFT_228375 [Blakeslea trispora]|nr:hypothetical protein BD560DRAFT_228375 [Blakeslea trispora]